MSKNLWITRFTIPGELTDLNEYIKTLNGNRYAANTLKQEETERVAWLATAAKKVEDYPVVIHIDWYSKDRRKDIDNISSFGRKVILDGIVMAGILPDDSRKYISGLSDNFYIDKKDPRAEVFIHRADVAR